MHNYIELLKHKKQIILQGPPGTGKTYTAKDIAEQMIFSEITEDKKEQKKRLENSEQFKLVQFHPSFSYEDFVRGITAKNEGGIIKYETENKILAEFARKVQNEALLQTEELENILSDEQVFHYITLYATNLRSKLPYDLGGNLRIVGVNITKDKVFFDVSTSKFRYWVNGEDIIILTQNFYLKKNNSIGGRVNIIKRVGEEFLYYLKATDNIKNRINKPFILIIDEINRANLPSVLGELIYALEYRGEKVEGMYSIDGDASIVIPENLYIIGTMNTADRSVGHIDYAIRRRFAFESLLPDETVINSDNAKELFKDISKLFVNTNKDGNKENSEHLAPDFDYKDVQLGHSYFILKDKNSEEELKMRLQYEILPILEEYIKDGLLLETAISQIKEIKKDWNIGD